MNSLPRLVSRELQKTDATDLTSKQAIIIDRTSDEELKEINLNNPTFTNMSCSSFNCVGTCSITGQANTGNITGNESIIGQDSLSFLQNVTIVGYTRIRFDGTQGNKTQSIYDGTNHTWYQYQPTRGQGVIIGNWNNLNIKFASQDDYAGFIQISGSDSAILQGPYLILYTGIQGFNSDGGDSIIKSKYFEINSEHQVECTIDVDVLITDHSPSLGVATYSGYLYMYLFRL